MVVGVGYVRLLSLVRIAVPRVMYGGLIGVPDASVGVRIVRHGTAIPRSLITLRNCIEPARMVRSAVTSVARVRLTLLEVVVRGEAVGVTVSVGVAVAMRVGRPQVPIPRAAVVIRAWGVVEG